MSSLIMRTPRNAIGRIIDPNGIASNSRKDHAVIMILLALSPSEGVSQGRLTGQGESHD